VGEADIPRWATHVVPLDGHRAVLVGGNPWPQQPVAPVVAIVDWQAGTAGPTTVVASHSLHEGFDMGRGNPWVQVDPTTALIGTTHGILAIDTRTGEAFHVDGEFDDGARVNECCSMVWDAARGRLVIASSVVLSEPRPHESGRLEVYRIR
jgi:hypothetical protein